MSLLGPGFPVYLVDAELNDYVPSWLFYRATNTKYLQIIYP